ncbi:hypothetical protein UPYG_G00048680 [Umbra pygmaea]|uniref:Uncharacterized protein n=1 Tax=Umbra pygmaea TaxID=75934 RepID=A0ABD0YD66_UMBPY
MEALNNQVFTVCWTEELKGFIYGVFGGSLLCLLLLTTGSGDLLPGPEDVHEDATEGDKGLAIIVTLEFRSFIVYYLPMIVVGLMSRATVRRGVLFEIYVLCGIHGFLVESFIVSQSDILIVYKYTEDRYVKSAGFFTAVYWFFATVGMWDPPGIDGVKLKAATVSTALGILRAIWRKPNLLTIWWVPVVLLVPTYSFWLVEAFGLRGFSLIYEGWVGIIIGAIAAAWFWGGIVGILATLDLLLMYIISCQ